ncbi:hypothetical protein TorRG33x02_129090 [Trema orientale]|uniref:Uncharacterized protein n=1 Tax=Trema orientale TaxID=63057 RepID=A0A2P5F0M6_TREOI|nr:hypothetical protein TorRG33x02_129090 [Trema orientale]
MGASLCIFRHSSSSTNTTKRPDNHQLKSSLASNKVGANGNSSPYCSAILGLIRRPGGCLGTDQKAEGRKLSLRPPAANHDHQKKIMNKRSKKVSNLTLEDWLLDSPGKKPDQINGGELYLFRHSRKIHPSSKPSSSSSSHHNSSTTLASKAKDSFSLEPVLKTTCKEADDQVLAHDHHDDQLVSTGASSNSMMMMSRSRSGKSIKKVSFREEPDIIIIYSPEEDLSI